MDTPRDIKVTIFGKTDVGLVREHNEDSFLVSDATTNLRTNDLKAPIEVALGAKGALFLVCDGMGGAAAGEVASQMAVESIAGALASAEPTQREGFARLLRRSIEDANDKIYAQSRDNQSERGMGTTCTAAALMDSTLVVGQIGDSRCYVMRNGRLGQVTKDQSLAWQLIEAGAMAPEDAKQFEHANIILQALGVQERVDVVLSQVDLRRGDIALISSDGLHGPVSDEEIAEIMADAGKDIQKAGERLIARALEREGPDNVTVVLALFEGEGLAEPTEADLIQFVGYDPGRDPVEVPRPRHDHSEKETQEVAIPKEFLRAHGARPEDFATAPTGEVPTDLSAPASPAQQVAEGRERRSVMLFLVIALVAGLGALFLLQMDRARALEDEEARAKAAAAAAAATPAPPPVAPIPDASAAADGARP